MKRGNLGILLVPLRPRHVESRLLADCFCVRIIETLIVGFRSAKARLFAGRTVTLNDTFRFADPYVLQPIRQSANESF